MALPAALVSLLIGANGGRASWPPEFNPWWLCAGFAVPGALVMCFAAARTSQTIRERSEAGLATVITLVSAWPSILGYVGTYRDYPWLLLFPFALFVVGGLLLSRQFLVLIGTVVFVGVWFGPALQPAGPPLPRVLSSDGLTLTLSRASGWGGASTKGYALLLESSPEIDGSYRFDLDQMEISADAGPFIDLKCSRTWSVTEWSQTKLYVFEAFLPHWVRSWNLKIRIADRQGKSGNYHADFELDGLPNEGSKL